MAGDTLGPVVNGVAITFAIWTFFVLSLRIFARICVLGNMGLDDYLIICACLLSWAFIGVTIASVENGLGKHMDDFDMSRMETYSFVVWLSSLFYLSCLGFVKTSALAFYTRLGDRYLTRMSIAMGVVVTAQALSFVLTAAFQCSPVRKAWDVNVPGKCVRINVFYLANAALNILTDVLTYSLPIRVILKLQVPRKQKIALGFILCLGLFACISSIVRITYVPPMLTSPDATYVIAPAMYWSVIETNVGIFAASIPSFKAIASRYLPRIIGEYSSRKKSAPWSSNTDPKKYGVGFSKVSSQNGVALDTLHGAIDNTGAGAGTSSGNQSGYGSGSSEERFIIPDGKILHETQINVEVSSDYHANITPSHEWNR